MEDKKSNEQWILRRRFEIANDWYTAMGKFDAATIMNTLAEDVAFVIEPTYKEKVPYLGTWVGKDAFAEALRIRNETLKDHGLRHARPCRER
jgi:ketosteroid isomerase-like protein